MVVHLYYESSDGQPRVNGEWLSPNVWETVNVAVAELTDSFEFFSSSNGGAVAVYMWFEFVNLNDNPYNQVIYSGSFTGTGSFSASDFRGEIDGVEFTGVRLSSFEYQPSFYFTEGAIDRIKSYSRTMGYTKLAIHVYAQSESGQPCINGIWMPPNEWDKMTVRIDDLSVGFRFWDTCDRGEVAIYLWFEFIKPGDQLINADSFVSAGNSAFVFEDYEGSVDGVTFKGVKAISYNYQPGFYFTQDAVDEIRDYAEKNGFDTLKIHYYGEMSSGQPCLGGNWLSPNMWETVGVDIEDVTVGYRFWNTCDKGAVTVYVWFDFAREPVVSYKSFNGLTGSGYSFSDFSGTVNGVTFDGVHVSSIRYQPTFRFNEYGVGRIKGYAEANGLTTLTMHIYSVLTNNGFVVNGTWTPPGKWITVDAPVSDLSAEYSFWSQSEGTTEVYMWFEFKPIVAANSFTGASGSGYEFSLYSGTVGGTAFDGVRAVSGNNDPYYWFNEYGVSRIKEHAAANGFDTMTIHVYGESADGAPYVNNQFIAVNEWASVKVATDDLAAGFNFGNTATAGNTMYMWFEFTRESADEEPVVTEKSFTSAGGSGYVFSLYSGTVAGVTFDGIKASSSRDDPYFRFNEYGVSRVKDYAAANGYGTFIIHFYSECSDGAPYVNDVYVEGNAWVTVSVAVSDLLVGFDFGNTSTGGNNIYMWFEFA